MDNELLNEEMAEQTTDENPIGDAAEAGGKEQGSETPAVPADGEQQEEQTMTEITGTVTVDNLYERPIMSTPFSQYTVTPRVFCCCPCCWDWCGRCLEFGIIKGGYDEQYFSNFM